MAEKIMVFFLFLFFFHKMGHSERMVSGGQDCRCSDTMLKGKEKKVVH